MAITDWPNNERPREKCLSKGAQALSDAELLAILLRTGVRGKTALDLARDLLNHFGSLRQLFQADYEQITKISGLGITKFIFLQAVREIGRRTNLELLPKRVKLYSAQLVKQFFLQQLHDYQHEVFCCLVLDGQNRVLHFAELFHGTLDYAQIYPREMVKYILKNNAKRVIIAHNHPSGKLGASPQDLQFTKSLKRALDFLEIDLLDHLIISEFDCYSMMENGLL
ncbi:MAG: DNA repair protein RadC [Legionellales bacterium]|nr:DNA repair protein RadC [Legionellales bacterium]